MQFIKPRVSQAARLAKVSDPYVDAAMEVLILGDAQLQFDVVAGRVPLLEAAVLAKNPLFKRYNEGSPSERAVFARAGPMASDPCSICWTIHIMLDRVSHTLNVAQRGDALVLLQSLADACTPLVFFDPQHRAVLDKPRSSARSRRARYPSPAVLVSMCGGPMTAPVLSKCRTRF
jgi:hypothetical protein